MKPVVTLTFNPTVDAASEADVIHATHKIRTRKESFHPGGGGINVARMITRLGGNTNAIYARGGVMGTVLDHLLEKRSINKEIIDIQSNTRINNVIYENSTGLEYRFVAEGPVLKTEEWQACIKACEEQDWGWLVVSGSLPRGVPVKVYDQLIHMASERKAEIVLDTSGAALDHIMAHGGATLIKPSHNEFESCTRKHYTSAADIANAAQELVHKGTSKIIAVTLGHDGAVLATADKKLYLPAPRVNVVSASGAGDSFIGGIVHVLARGGDIEEAFKLGVACGSAAVMEKGTKLCRIENVERLYQDLLASQTEITAFSPDSLRIGV